MTSNFNEKNIAFLKWIDNLRYLTVFSKWRFESPNISEPNMTSDEFILNNPSNKFLDKYLRVFTDGSFNRHNRKRGCGVTLRIKTFLDNGISWI
jgi:hypothetical protein